MTRRQLGVAVHVHRTVEGRPPNRTRRGKINDGYRPRETPQRVTKFHAFRCRWENLTPLSPQFPLRATTISIHLESITQRKWHLMGWCFFARPLHLLSSHHPFWFCSSTVDFLHFPTCLCRPSSGRPRRRISSYHPLDRHLPEHAPRPKDTMEYGTPEWSAEYLQRLSAAASSEE